MVDEFRTSKLCCTCHTEMEGLFDPATNKPSYALRVCKNVNCQRKVWDQNVSASINILKLFLHYVKGENRPAAFCRSLTFDTTQSIAVDSRQQSGL